MELSLLGPICAFFSAFTWAVGSAGYSRLSETNTPFAINFNRAMVALPLSIVAAFVVSGGFKEGVLNYQALSRIQVGWLSLSMIASYGVGDILFLSSIRSLGLPGALAIASCYPIWTVVFGYLFANDILSKIQFSGLLITLLGVVLVVLNAPQARGKKLNFSAKGLFLAMSASACWALNSFATSRGGAGVIAPIGNTIRMAVGILMTAVFSYFWMPGRPLFLPKKQFFSSFWLFCFEAFGGSYFYFYGMAHSPLVLGATLTSLAPVISVPVALIWGLEKFSLIRTFGVGIVVLGVCLLLGPG